MHAQVPAHSASSPCRPAPRHCCKSRAAKTKLLLHLYRCSTRDTHCAQEASSCRCSLAGQARPPPHPLGVGVPRLSRKPAECMHAQQDKLWTRMARAHAPRSREGYTHTAASTLLALWAPRSSAPHQKGGRRRKACWTARTMLAPVGSSAHKAHHRHAMLRHVGLGHHDHHGGGGDEGGGTRVRWRAGKCAVPWVMPPWCDASCGTCGCYAACPGAAGRALRAMQQ